MLGNLLVILTVFAGPPASAAAAQVILVRRTGCRWPDWKICIHWCGTAVMLAFLYLAVSLWVAAAAAAASAVLAVLWLWWRRKGRRLLSLLTSKYQYIRDAMVRVMRERARSRPALRPVPEATR